jgi:hypothetical protein
MDQKILKEALKLAAYYFHMWFNKWINTKNLEVKHLELRVWLKKAEIY